MYIIAYFDSHFLINDIIFDQEYCQKMINTYEDFEIETLKKFGFVNGLDDYILIDDTFKKSMDEQLKQYIPTGMPWWFYIYKQIWKHPKYKQQFRERKLKRLLCQV